MQRSGQTAKTQSSAEAPGRRALSPAPSWEAKERAPTRAASRREGRLGQPGALGRRGSPSVPGLGPLAAPQRPALRNAPPRPCGELRSLSRGGTCEQHHPHGTGFGSRPRSAGPRDGREGARLREAAPAGAAGERGLRSAATTARKLRRRPSSVPGGQSLPEAAGGGGWKIVLPRRFSYLRHQRYQRLLHGARADLQPRVRAQPRRGRRGDAAAAARGRGHSGGAGPGLPPAAPPPRSRTGSPCPAAPLTPPRPRAAAPAGAPLPRRAMPRARAQPPLGGPFPAPRDRMDLKRQLPLARSRPSAQTAPGAAACPPAPLLARSPPQPADEGNRDRSRHHRSHPEFPVRSRLGRGQTECPCPRGEAGAGGG